MLNCFFQLFKFKKMECDQIFRQTLFFFSLSELNFYFMTEVVMIDDRWNRVSLFYYLIVPYYLCNMTDLTWCDKPCYNEWDDDAQWIITWTIKHVLKSLPTLLKVWLYYDVLTFESNFDNNWKTNKETLISILLLWNN